jgi:hypothetical protein
VRRYNAATALTSIKNCPFSKPYPRSILAVKALLDSLELWPGGRLDGFLLCERAFAVAASFCSNQSSCAINLMCCSELVHVVGNHPRKKDSRYGFLVHASSRSISGAR